METRELKKVLVTMSGSTYQNIEELKEALKDNNRSNIVAKSVELAKYITDAKKSNKKILIEDENGNVKQIEFIGL